MEVFDEDKAVEFIRTRIHSDGRYSSDDILEVIDMIWDYYEDNGMLDIDMDDDSQGPEGAERDKLVAHVVKMVRKDRGCRIDPDDVPAIVDAELAYEKMCDE